MIKARKYQYYVSEKLITNVMARNGKFYASDKCCKNFEIEEQDYNNLKGNFEMKVYEKMCSCCPHAKECHNDCESCDDYFKELGRVVDE